MRQHHLTVRIIRGFRGATLAFIGVIAMVTIATDVDAGEPSLEVISAWGGPVNDVEVALGGNTAYIAAGRRLVVADITNLAAITEIGSIELGANVRDVAIQNNLAYVATAEYPSIFCVVDISDPANPTRIWTSSDVSNEFWQVQLRSTFVYARDDFRHVNVYDITVPNAPAFLGYIDNIDSFDIAGSLLYAVKDSTPEQLLVFDLSGPDPVNPPLIGSLVLGGRPRALAASGNYAYVTVDAATNYVAIIDVSIPTAPVIVNTSIPAPGTPFQILTAFNGHLYVNSGRTVGIYNVTNPVAPALLTTYTTHGSVRGIRFPAGTSNNLGWALDDGEGAIALNLNNPASPVRLGNYHSPAELRGMAKSGSQLYVVDGWNGLTILDVSNPQTTPTVLGVFQTPQPPVDAISYTNWGVELDGTRAWFTAGRRGVYVVDVSNPAVPSLVTTLPPPSTYFARAIDVANGVAHVSYYRLSPTGIWQYRTYNVNTFAVDATIAVNGGNAPTSIAVNAQGIAFTGRRQESPQAIDASNPNAPVVINDNAGPMNSEFVALDGNIRFLANGSDTSGPDAGAGGVYVHDVTNPANPILLSFIPAPFTNSVAVQNSRAYMITSECLALDVTNPSAPQPIVSTQGIGLQYSTMTFVDDPYLFVTTAVGESTGHNNHGLVILNGENLDIPPAVEANKIYWVEPDHNAIRRANSNGTNVETILDFTDGLLEPKALAFDLDAGKMYFTHNPAPNEQNDIKIQRANLDGTAVEDVISGLPGPSIIRVDHDGGKIYWSHGGSSSFITRANLNGTGVEVLHQLGGITGFDLDLTNGRIYWTLAPSLACLRGQGKIQRSNLDGTNIEDVVVGLDPVSQIRIDPIAGKMYWTSAFSNCGMLHMFRANLDGSMVEAVIEGCCSALGLDIDHVGGKLYVTASEAIKRANLDGSGLEDLITAGVSSATRIQIIPTLGPLCPADINGNGAVNIDDLLAVISHWGPNPGPWDVTGNGVVNIDDLLAVISAWGPCD
jgi:hypothetical protein